MADRASFDEFYLVARSPLLRQLTAMTTDPELAADVLQEAFARAWQRWGRVSSLDDPPGWVRTVAWRLAVSHFRRVAVAQRFRATVRPDHVASSADEHLDIQAALRLLNAEQRRALVLHDLVGLSVAEVAAETAVAEGTVKSRLSRGRERLAVLLGPAYAAAVEEETR